MDDLHRQGIDAATGEHDYDRAHALYGQALDAINTARDDSLSATLQADTQDTQLIFNSDAACVQEARVWRDDGFVNIREALAGPNLQTRAKHFATARQALDRSQAALWEKVNPQGGIYRNNREAWGEYGTSRGALGRLATAEMVSAKRYSREASHSPDPKEVRELYEDAHAALRRGSNTYYLVSNAVNAARHERIFGTKRGVVKWLGRAAFGLAQGAGRTISHTISIGESWATKDILVRDWRDLKAASKTTIKRSTCLRSRRAAELSAGSSRTI